MVLCCPKCGGDGVISREVIAVGPIRPLPGALFRVGDRRLNHVPLGKIGIAHCHYVCHVCEGRGIIAR